LHLELEFRALNMDLNAFMIVLFLGIKGSITKSSENLKMKYDGIKMILLFNITNKNMRACSQSG
jgi:hypothetical protein